jgi:hypothetical protein
MEERIDVGDLAPGAVVDQGSDRAQRALDRLGLPEGVVGVGGSGVEGIDDGE